jgi:hypothetical protein
MKTINQVAFHHAAALLMQNQNDLRTIVIKNITTEASFIMEGRAKQLEKALTGHHLLEKIQLG